MEVQFLTEGDVVVVRISGQLNYEKVDSFRENCLQNLTSQKVIFNLKNLNFVGSSGITPFLETMVDLAQKNSNGVRFCGVGSEFKKIFEASPLKSAEIHMDENGAKSSFLMSEVSSITSIETPRVTVKLDEMI